MTSEGEQVIWNWRYIKYYLLLLLLLQVLGLIRTTIQLNLLCSDCTIPLFPSAGPQEVVNIAAIVTQV